MQIATSPIDIAIVLAYMAATIAFGVWIGRNSSGTDDYLLGGRNLPWWALLGSLVATETSTATFLSVPGISFASPGDFRFLQLAIGYIIGRSLVAVILLPNYFKGRLSSAYEVLEKQFGIKTRRMASLVFLVTRNLGDGLRLYLTAIALEKTLGLSLPICISVIGVVTIVYTVFGGMKSVVWNDCIQFVVYVIGGLVSLAAILMALPNGTTTLTEFIQSNGGARLFGNSNSFRTNLTDANAMYAGIVGGLVLTLGTHGTDQMMVQRFLSARKQSDAAKAVILSGFVVLLQFALFLLLGTALACFYNSFPPEVAFEKGDSVFASFIVEQLPVGIVGFTLAAVFSAAMSTLSSSLNSSASAWVNDFVFSDDTDAKNSKNALRLSKLVTVAFGIVQIAIGIGAAKVSHSVVGDALAIAGFSAGMLLGVFLLGRCFRRHNDFAGLLGMSGGLLALLFVKFGPKLVEHTQGFPWPDIVQQMPVIAWPWFALIGATVTFLVGGLFNAILGVNE